MRPGFKPTAEEQTPEFEAQQNHNRAVRRAKQNIRWLCKTMQADRLFTLTYRENQTDREQVRADSVNVKPLLPPRQSRGISQMV
jgi:hypothetical protein